MFRFLLMILCLFGTCIPVMSQGVVIGQDESADVVDHTSFDSLWKESTVRGKLLTTGWNSMAYRNYRNVLSTARPSAFLPNSRAAFWVNAYLACLLEIMHLRTGYRSTMWDSLWLMRDTFEVAGRGLTLRDMVAEATIAAGTAGIVSCLPTGSSSGAPLPPRAAYAKNVRILMRDQLRRICRSERYLLYDPAGKVLQCSAFFIPLQEAMKNEAGSLPRWVLPFVTDGVAAQMALGANSITTFVHDRIETWRKARPP